MKIMTTIYTLKKGGAYGRFLMMVEAFVERRCEVHCLSLTPIQIENPFYHNHIIYFPFKKKDGPIAKLTVLSIFPLWAVWLGWRNKIDLIIAFGSLYAFIQGFAKWVLRKSMVTLIRGQSSFGLQIRNSSKWAHYLNHFIETVGFHFSDRIIANNVTARDEILKRVQRKENIDVKLLYNNIPTRNVRNSENNFATRDKYDVPKDAKVLVTVGILNKGKNIETLIEGVSKTRMRDVYLLIVGEGSTEADCRYKDSLQELAKQLAVDRQVIFTGWLEKDDLRKVYLASDLFVSPSLSEGMPNALLEALGSDLPCLGSNIPGIRDILQHDELLFDLSSGEALGEKIRRVLCDPGGLQQLKELCQERKMVFVFDWKKRIYQVIVGEDLS